VIVVDTSALAALLFGESDTDRIAGILEREPSAITAVNWVELGIVIEARTGPEGIVLLDELFRRSQIEVRAVDADVAHDALVAWRRFGKGNHPAALNLGDTFSYALARRLDVPLLFVGDDFTKTDVTVA
jgi:ribonuclease VapC